MTKAQQSPQGFYVWITSCTPNLRLATIDGLPLTEREADKVASNFDRSRRAVVRPASYQGAK